MKVYWRPLVFRTDIFLTVSLLLGSLLGLTTHLWAQSAANSGQIIGRVVDPSDAVVPGAEITVRNKNTNYQRISTTDESGRYALLLVPLGPYDVSAKAEGFEESIREIELTLGSSVTANFQLRLGARSEAVEVTANTSSLEPTRVPSKSILTEMQIHNLPSNGRRVLSFLLLTPTTTRAVFSDQGCRGISISGQAGIYSKYNVDGGDYNSTFACGTRGRSETAPTFSLEALQEFQVVRNIFSTEFGRSTGGIVNMATKSGTNQFHGSALYLVRDGSLAAKDALDQQSLTRIHQFGGSFGGPISTDRTFFFTAPEVQKASKPVQILFSELDTQGVRNTPGAQALLSVAPEENFPAISDSQMVVNRLDHHFSDRNSLFGRFDFSRSVYSGLNANVLSTGPNINTVTNAARSSQTVYIDRSYTTMAQWTSVLSPRHVNELRFQFAREVRPQDPVSEGANVTVRNAGTVIGSYGPRFASLGFNPVSFESSDDRYQLINNFSLIGGAHTAKLGFDFTRVNGNIFSNNGGYNGSYDFNTLADFLARRPRQYSQFTGTGSLGLTLDQLAVYAQEEWRVRPNLTISPGFRYEAQFNPDYLAPTAPQDRAPQATRIPNDTRMFAPRVGIAWNVGNDGKTVLRAGGGLFYATTIMSTLADSILFNGGNPDRAFSVVVNDPTALANAFRSIGVDLANAPLNNLPTFTSSQFYQAFGGPGGATGRSVNYFDPNYRNPKALQWQFSGEREIASGIKAGIGFNYISTVRVARQRDTNLPAPVVDALGRNIYSGPRPLAPKFVLTKVAESSARSLYRSFTMLLNARRPSYTLDAYYTLGWNYTFDDIERSFGIGAADANNMKNDYGYSNIDERHQLTANGLYFLPYGFEISSTARFTSGRPFSGSPGTDLNLDSRVNDRAMVNGEILRRNTFRNRGVFDVNLRVQRSFSLPNERGKLIVSAEMFNVFGFDNYLLGGASTRYGPGTVIQNGVPVSVPPSADFLKSRDSQGRYLKSGSVGDPFQAQLGLRFQF